MGVKRGVLEIWWDLFSAFVAPKILALGVMDFAGAFGEVWFPSVSMSKCDVKGSSDFMPLRYLILSLSLPISFLPFPLQNQWNTFKTNPRPNASKLAPGVSATSLYGRAWALERSTDARAE